MTFLEKKNVFFVINGSKYIIYVEIARGDRIPLISRLKESSSCILIPEPNAKSEILNPIPIFISKSDIILN